MKFVKKLVGTLGVVGALAVSTPASALITLELFAGNGLSLGFAQSLGTTLALTGRVNNWDIAVDFGTSLNPALGLTLTSNVFRTATNQNNFLQCEPNAVSGDPNQCSITTTTNQITGNNGGVNVTGVQQVSLGTADPFAAFDGTLKIRFNDDTFNVIVGQTYPLLETLNTARQETRTYNVELIATGDPAYTNLNVALDNNNPFSRLINYTPGVTPVGLQGGIDLVAGTAVQDVNNGFFSTYEVRAKIPEPGSLALIGLGLVGVAALRRRSVKAA